MRLVLCLLLLVSAQIGAAKADSVTGFFSVKTFGAKGDGKSLDTDAVNAAIQAAHDTGGGTVQLPAGSYLCFSIHLQSNVALYLNQGATLVAAEPAENFGSYDLPEPNQWDKWQDFGHSHFHNSLLWGENLENVSITGPGRIHGKGLSKGERGRMLEGSPTPEPDATPAPSAGPTDSRDTLIPSPRYATAPGAVRRVPTYPTPRDTLRDGIGNKAISLKNCRNVILRDFSILHGGHFGILATGVDNLTIDNLRIDTNRDGMDIDCCRNVRISNCTVNSPWDDGICLKSSYALGYLRSTDHVTITNCYVTGGYLEGTVLDATFKHFPVTERLPHHGRIKCGTESNGGFKNITISNCVFDYCGGLVIESVDGAIVEDITVSNLAMRDIVNSPIFIRLGARLRGPDNPPIGAIRRVNISNIVCSNAVWRYGSVISGVPGHSIEDLSISDVRLVHQGGGTAAETALHPPENEPNYPDPEMFGTMPSYGFFVRHVRNLTMHHAELSFAKDDARAAISLQDVTGADLDHVNAKRLANVPLLLLHEVTDLTVRDSRGVPDFSEQAPTRNSL
ncbi:MAG: hypothetical protein QOD99_1546 [Chthoniobacter sp.]|jgi:polygalacturonase|nr:hypothetical protein [Chthoniobacter sp.]